MGMEEGCLKSKYIILHHREGQASTSCFKLDMIEINMATFHYIS